MSKEVRQARALSALNHYIILSSYDKTDFSTPTQRGNNLSVRNATEKIWFKENNWLLRAPSVYLTFVLQEIYMWDKENKNVCSHVRE